MITVSKSISNRNGRGKLKVVHVENEVERLCAQC